MGRWFVHILAVARLLRFLVNEKIYCRNALRSKSSRHNKYRDGEVIPKDTVHPESLLWS